MSTKEYYRKWRAGWSEEKKIAVRAEARARWEHATATRFGFTLEEWRAEKIAHPNCAICGLPLSDDVAFNHQKTQATRHADHDHETGQFRDFLCGFCNLVIGYSGESIEVLEKVITYLKKHGENYD